MKYHHPETGGMGFRKAVAAKAFKLSERAFGKFSRVAVIKHAPNLGRGWYLQRQSSIATDQCDNHGKTISWSRYVLQRMSSFEQRDRPRHAVMQQRSPAGIAANLQSSMRIMISIKAVAVFPPYASRRYGMLLPKRVRGENRNSLLPVHALAYAVHPYAKFRGTLDATIRTRPEDTR